MLSAMRTDAPAMMPLAALVPVWGVGLSGGVRDGCAGIDAQVDTRVGRSDFHGLRGISCHAVGPFGPSCS